jgi:sucrose-6-phosphatase
VAHDDPDHAALRELVSIWTPHASTSSLVYSTGRSLAKYLELRAFAPPMPHPDLLICSVGTEIYRLVPTADDDRTPILVKEWSEFLSHNWDADQCRTIAADVSSHLVLQEASEQRPHKVSFHLDTVDQATAQDVVDRLQSALRAASLDAQVIYSGGRDVDVLPVRAGKGQACAWVLDLMEQGAGRPSVGTLVCGDSGNDRDLFIVPGVVGVAVRNAHPELRAFVEREIGSGNTNILFATRTCAGGIVEALAHFKLFEG